MSILWIPVLRNNALDDPVLSLQGIVYQGTMLRDPGWQVILQLLNQSAGEAVKVASDADVSTQPSTYTTISAVWYLRSVTRSLGYDKQNAMRSCRNLGLGHLPVDQIAASTALQEAT